MKKFIIFLIIFLQGYFSFSQSLYEIKFKDQKNSTIEYTCFLVYYNENDCYMRIKFYNSKNEFRVVNVTYKGSSGKYTTGLSYFSLTGSNPVYITSKSEGESYNADYFVWMGSETLPYTTDVQPNVDGSRNVFKVTSYKKLKVNELTSTYLRSFYGSSESDYLSLIKMSDDNLTKPVYATNTTTLHLIVLANTDISDIGAGCKVDMEHLDTEFESISEALNIKYKKYLLDGYDFSKSSYETTIKNMEINKSDIVVFFYRGHGFRWSDQTSAYPSLALTRSHMTNVNSSNTLLLDNVYNSIVAKGGRLNMVIADCCNTSIGVPQFSTDNYLYMQSNASADYSKLKEMFLNRSGNLIFTASKIGEVSWTSGYYGGFFTSSFLQALTQEVSYLKTTESSWVNVINNTYNFALNKSSSCFTCSSQHAVNYNQIVKN